MTSNDNAKNFSVLAGSAYLLIGVLHSVWFDLSISRSDCIAADGLVRVVCNTGLGISHFVATVGWPLHYL